MYETIDSLRQRISQEVPSFDASRDDALLKVWVYSAMKVIDSDRLFEKAQADIHVVNGKGALPPDFYGVWSIPSGCSLRPGQGQLTARIDGTYRLGYWGIPMDEQGYPLIPDVAVDAIVAYVDFKSTELDQKRREISSDYQFRVDVNRNRLNEQRANNLLVEVRGNVNMLSLEESVAFAAYRQFIAPYRNS